MLPGLMSRCTTPRSCAKPRPSATCSAISTASIAGIVALAHARAQVGAFQQLHRHVGEVVLLAEVEDGDDVRVGELARGLRLEHEAPLVLLAALDLVAEADGLQRDDAVERRVLGLVDDAHRAAAELAEDLVAPDLVVFLLLRHQVHLLPAQPLRVALAPAPRRFSSPGSCGPRRPAVLRSKRGSRRPRRASATTAKAVAARIAPAAPPRRARVGLVELVRAQARVGDACPPAATAASAPGAASASACRNSRVRSSFCGPASSAIAAATAMPSPSRPSSRCLARSARTAPCVMPMASGRPAAPAASVRSAMRSAPRGSPSTTSATPSAASRTMRPSCFSSAEGDRDHCLELRAQACLLAPPAGGRNRGS